MKRLAVGLVAGAAILIAACTPSVTVENTGTEDFGGVIGRTVAESEPWWPDATLPPAGTPNVVMILLDEFRFFNGLQEDMTAVAERLDDIGTRRSHSNYPWGWAQVGNTPAKRYKQNTHVGGVRDPRPVGSWSGSTSGASSAALLPPGCGSVTISSPRV